MRELQKLLQSFRTDLMDDGHKDEDPIMEQYDHFTDDVVKLFAIAGVGQSLPDSNEIRKEAQRYSQMTITPPGRSEHQIELDAFQAGAKWMKEQAF